MIIATATQIKNAFGKYLDLARIHGEVQIKKHGHIIAKLVGVDDSISKVSSKENDENSI